MCDFLHVNVSLWDIKKTGYRRVDKKAKLWEDQGKAMGKSVEHLQGWFKSLRDTHTRLDKNKSGDGAPGMTEREQWVKANFGFLKTVVRHRAEPVNSVKETIAAHRGDLEAACADLMVGEDKDNTSSAVPKLSSQAKGKRGHDDDQFLQSLQKRVLDSGELLKVLVQPQPITATVAFANYLRDCLLSMSMRKFRKARSRFTAILSEVLDEDSDDEEPRIVRTVSAPASVRGKAPATYQPPCHMWRHKAPAVSAWGVETSVHVDPDMQQPQSEQMMPPPPQHGFQLPPAVNTQQPSFASASASASACASAAIGSADQLPNQSASAFDTSDHSIFNISGLSGMLNLSSDPISASTPSGELKTPPPPEHNYI